MERIKLIAPRPNWQAKCEELGFDWHTSVVNGASVPYWDETVCYKFTGAEIDKLEEVANELHQLSLNAIKKIIENGWLDKFPIPRDYHQYVIDSWRRGDLSMYGRFDLAWNGIGEPKLLEYNADTPTSLFEASVVQWQWMEEVRNKDQFNSLHERLITRWGSIADEYIANDQLVHFACLKNTPEDFGTSKYMADVAMQAGVSVRGMWVEDIGYDNDQDQFVDEENNPIDVMFKLYPWEWLFNDEYGKYVVNDQVDWIEPAWKLLLSCKAILPILWNLYPDHPNLLPAYFDSAPLGNTYVRKPIYSREGQNISITQDGKETHTDNTGGYGAEGYIYQQFNALPNFDGNFPVLGCWVVGDEAGGLGIREDNGLVTTNTSRFVPHYFE